MYFDSKDVYVKLNCAYCNRTFGRTENVRVIPRCGNSICAVCYSEVKSSLSRSRTFNCKACLGKSHKMPHSGCPTNTAIQRLLAIQPIQKPLNDVTKSLKKSIEHMVTKMSSIERRFAEKSFELNSHFDAVEQQIFQAADESIKHILKLRNELVTTLNRNRDTLLAETVVHVPSDQALEAGECQQLYQDIQKYRDRWKSYFEQLNVCVNDEDIEKAQLEANSYLAKLNEIEKSFEQDELGGGERLMVFKPNDLFFEMDNHLGTLGTSWTEDDEVQVLGE